MNVAIDALNLAYWAGRLPTLRVALAVAAALVERGDRPVMFLDATIRHRYPHEAAAAAALGAGGEGIVVAPGGVPADRLLLRHARDHDGVILSRDHFRDHRRRFRRLIDDPVRRVEGCVASDRVRVPALAIDAPLPISADAAWQGWLSAQRGAVGIP